MLIDFDMLLKWPWLATTCAQPAQPIPTKQGGTSPHSRDVNIAHRVQSPLNPASVSTEQPPKNLKRQRFTNDSDIEGWEHLPRKKRRLRFELFTSRLSRPYATPPTHIVGTRASRVGIWSRQRLSGGKLLRKAAMLNSIAIKRRLRPEQSSSTKQL